MQIQYRAILPAPSHPSDPHPGDKLRSERRGSGGDQRPSKKRRVGVRVACNACRSSKLACDGNRPTCARCNKRGVVCKYVARDSRESLENYLEQLSQELQQHVDVLEHLRTAPEPEAMAAVRRLRSTPNMSDVLAAIRTQISPHRPSERRAIRAILPPTATDIEFELTILHDMSYPTLIPIDVNSIDLDNLANYRSATTAKAIIRGGEAAETRQANTIEPETPIRELPSPLRGGPTRRASPVSGPSRPPPYCDARLNDLRLRFWTKVPIGDEFAARAIAAYLEGDHAITGWFDADLFLNDLIERRIEHCSAFLVNAYLSIACLCYAGFDPRASSLGRALYREARIFHQAERFAKSITTVAAMMTLSLVAAELGDDNFSRELLVDARKMAESMDLFGVPHTSPAIAAYRQMSPQRIRAAAHVAWGTYGYLTFHAMFFKGDPIPYPPGLAIPGHDDDGATTDASGPRWPAHPLPAYIGHTFTSLCKFWSIVQEIMALYVACDGRSIQERVPLAFTESKYQRLLSLADTLASDMARGKHLPGHVLIFWSLYHIAVLDLFRPFVQETDGQRLMSFKSIDSSPDAIFNASLRQLQRLIFDYLVGTQPRRYSVWLNTAAMHVGSTALQNLDDKAWRFYFLLCMKYWKEGVTCFPVFAMVAQANLTLAMEVGCVTGAEAHALMEEMRVRAHHHERAEIASTSSILDFDRALSAGESGFRIDELAQRFDDLIMFDQLTTGAYEAPEGTPSEPKGKGGVQ